MRFRDAFRSQYYLRVLAEGRASLISALLDSSAVLHIETPTTIADQVAVGVGDAVDQILLPTISYEVFEAKVASRLRGDSPEQRYDSFFLQDSRWTSRACALPSDYPFLFSMVDHCVRTSFSNIRSCVQALARDFAAVTAAFAPHGLDSVVELAVAQSDRHRGGKQPVIVSFASGVKLVYKPTDVRPERLFAEFCAAVGLPARYAPRCVKCLPIGSEYGWLQFVPHLTCSRAAEVESYYRRVGALLALADSLNYTDGHLENLVANGTSPVLIDCETMFQVFGEVDPELGERSVLFTGLVEKAPDPDSGRGFTAALQTPGLDRFEILHPFALNDRTDELAVRFRGVSSELSHNGPMLNGEYQPPTRHIENVLDGYSTAYDRITRLAPSLLDKVAWWDELEAARPRQLIRHTLYYQLLIRKIQQPDACRSLTTAKAVVLPLLATADQRLQPVTRYELEEILRLDVPYFSHHPGGRDLYAGDGTCVQSYLPCSAIEDISRSLTDRSTARRDRNIAILRNVLRFSPSYRARVGAPQKAPLSRDPLLPN